MERFVKPNVVISKCLEFEACRYNGDVIHDFTVQQLMSYVNFIPVCPEVEIGLGTPRETIRIVQENGENRLIQPSTKVDLTDKMKSFSMDFLGQLSGIDGFIMKNRSPSCGLQDVKIYAKADQSPTVGRDAGIFGANIIAKFGHLALEEEGRLKNFKIRELFLTKLFTLAIFRKLKEEERIQSLIQFQSENKYLFMMYNQVIQKELGRIIALHKSIDTTSLFREYEQKLYELFQKAPSSTSVINVCQHIYGYFKKELNPKEKEYFNTLLEKFREKKVPLSTIMTLLKSWAIRFEMEYLIQQRIFEAYPEQLVEITDSGKGRDY